MPLAGALLYRPAFDPTRILQHVRGALRYARKLFVQERRDWKLPGAPRIGWKRGELIEVLQARSVAEFREEWGDVGYYAAQSFTVVWWLYRIVTPRSVISSACAKFERRAKREK